MFFSYTDRNGRLCSLNLMQVWLVEFDDATETLRCHCMGQVLTIEPRPSDYYTLKSVLSGHVAPMPVSEPSIRPV